ncbi:MmcB family DNA repair protein [Clostridium sp. YIM B02515]|uniref:MmcB family DNA repair protein n=1 Tax=Clostridium rhizosphaerae TaxID=2803861 RepID=A0ABS1TEF4_9CLOT|nr:MmcB family DNA repair protein [Clostridium rhizosphaerae]MBL4937743.1 MmcB family DNA repair protein [Clostridium rhizosphaerae]
MINGTDAKSIEALKLLDTGKPVSELMSILNLSLDQAKKLSQLNKLYAQASALPDSLYLKLKDLGLKALVLKSIFKENDMEGLREILESISVDIKRSDLEKLPQAIYEKRKHFEKTKIAINSELEQLSLKKSQIEDKLAELKLNKDALDQSLYFIRWASNEAKIFLMEHLGFFRDEIVLYKRLDINWQNALKKKGILYYDEENYIWIVNDIHHLIRDTEKRIKNNRDIKYDYKKANGLFEHYYPINAEYKNVTRLDLSISNLIKKNENELKLLEEAKKNLKKKISDLKSKSPKDFLQSIVISNELSKKDIETHATLQNFAMKWLYENNNICTSELSVDNYRFDVAGYNQELSITIVEAKASIEDFKRDIKWQGYLKYCNNFYFIFNDLDFNFNMGIILPIAKQTGIGILIVKKNKLEVILECNYENNRITSKDKIIFNIGRSACRRLIYGF